MAKKTGGTKKAATGTGAKKGASPEETDGRESLAKELKSLIPRLDAEGLAFLVEQARVHLYNMRVAELNEAAEAVETAGSRSRALAGSAPKSAPRAFRIDGSESGSSYYLHYGNDSVMFSRDEMARIVSIVNGEGSDLEIRERLYNWFDRERKDIFALANMKDKFDERLKALVSLLKKSFKIRKG